MNTGPEVDTQYSTTDNYIQDGRKLTYFNLDCGFFPTNCRHVGVRV